MPTTTGGAAPFPTALDVRRAMTFTSRTQRRRPERGIRILPGAHLSTDFLLAHPRSWQRRRIVAIARTWALVNSRPTCAPVGLSAALLADVPLSSPPEDVHIASTRSRAGRTTVFPEVRIRGRLLARECRTRSHARRALGGRTPSPSAEAPASWRDYECIALQCALIHPGEEGFVALCSILRILSIGSRDRWSSRLSDQSTTKARLLRTLESEDCRVGNSRDARWSIRNAEAECESVGEARLLWILRSRGVAGTSVQTLVSDGFENAYIDISIAELRIAIEFDGREKYGRTPEEQAAAWERQNSREHFLYAKGWTIVRFRWEDLDSPEFVLARVRAAIDSRSRRLRPVAKPRVRAH